MDTDLRDDFAALGVKLRLTLAALDDPEARASGSDAASLARTRRMMGPQACDDYVTELANDYDLLGDALGLSSGSGAAAVANERRMIRKELDALRAPEGVTKVAELASYRAARAETARTATRRRPA